MSLSYNDYVKRKKQGLIKFKDDEDNSRSLSFDDYQNLKDQGLIKFEDDEEYESYNGEGNLSFNDFMKLRQKGKINYEDDSEDNFKITPPTVVNSSTIQTPQQSQQTGQQSNAAPQGAVDVGKLDYGTKTNLDQQLKALDYEKKYKGYSLGNLSRAYVDSDSEEEKTWIENKLQQTATIDEIDKYMNSLYKSGDSDVQRVGDAYVYDGYQQTAKERQSHILSRYNDELSLLGKVKGRITRSKDYDEKNSQYEEKYKNADTATLFQARLNSDDSGEQEWLKNRLESKASSREYKDEIDRLTNEYDTLYDKLDSYDDEKHDATIEYMNKISDIKGAYENEKRGAELREKKESYSSLEKNKDFAEKSYPKEEPVQRGDLDNRKYMTSDEQAKYNYLENTQGKDKAEEYFKVIEPELNKRMTASETQKAADFAEAEPVLASAQSIGYNVISGAGFVEDVGKTLSGQYIDTNSFLNLPSNMRNTERQTVASNIDSDVGKWLYNTGMSAADSAVNIAISKGVGSVAGAFGAGAETVNSIASNATSIIMGSQVATQTVIESKAKGMTDDQAIALGLIHGLVEHVTEKVSVENILSDPRNFRQAIAKSFVSEGSEEVASNWLDRIADSVIEGDKNEERKKYNEYLAQGMSESEALSHVIVECLGEDADSFLAGGVSGVAMSGTSHAADAVTNAVGTRMENTDAGKEILSGENYEKDIDSLINSGKNLDDKKGKKLAENIEKDLSKGKKLSANEVGKLSRYVAESELQEVGSRYAEATKDMSDEDALTVASAAGKLASGKFLTTDEVEKLNQSPQLMQAVANTLGADEDATVTAVDTSEVSGSKATYQVSSSGSTEVNGAAFTGTVEIKSIDPKTGKTTYNLISSDGTTETADSDSVSFKTEAEAELYRRATAFNNVDEANAFIDSYKPGQDVDEYAREWGVYSNYGRMSVSLTDHNRLGGGYMLTNDQKYAAYEYGLEAYKSAAQQRKIAADALMKDADYGHVKQGSFTVNVSSATKLTREQKQAVTAVKAVTGLGINVEIFESKADKNGRLQGENGSFDPSTRTLRLDINAGFSTATGNRNSLNAAMRYGMINTAAHELTHIAKEGGQWDELRGAVVKTLEKGGHDFAKMVESKRESLGRHEKYADLTYDEMTDRSEEETIAEACETMLEDGTLLQELIENHPEQAKGLKAAIQKVINSIRDFFKKHGKYARTAEGKALLDALDKTEADLQAIWNNAVKEGAKAVNVKTAESNKKAADEGGKTTGIRFDQRIDDYPYNMQTVIRGYLNAVDKNLLDFINDARTETWKKRLEYMHYSFVNDLPVEILKRIEELAGIDVSSFAIQINGESIVHIEKRHGISGKHNQSMRDDRDVARMQYILSYADNVELTKNSSGNIAVDSQYRNADNTPSPLVSITKKINGTYYVVVAIPDAQKRIMHIKSAFIEKQGKNIEDNQESDAEAPDFTSETNLDISSKKNIPQLAKKSNASTQKNQDRDYLSAVERGDMETAQRMVDDAAERAFADSKVRDKDGNLLKLYHGRVSEFNVFERKYGNAEGNFGKGFYFTNDENDVNENYANENGADLEIKIDKLADELEFEEEYEDLNYDERRKIAESRYIKSEPNVVEGYLNITNPVYISKSNKGTFLDYYDNYNEETDEYEDEPEGLLVDFVEALGEVISDYVYSYDTVERIKASIYENVYFNEGISAYDLTEKIRNLDEGYDVTDENGNLYISEAMRQAFEVIGFDGIIDDTVSEKFKNMGLTEDSVHYIAFNSEQIKSADPVTYDDDGNVIPLSQRFNTKKSDIRYQDRFSDDDIRDHVHRHFGHTYSWNETGYITTDGHRLDFSGRHEGAPGGHRYVDHRDVWDGYPEELQDDLDGSDAMYDFISRGNIRIMPEAGVIHLTVAPTPEQKYRLRDFISRERGEVTLEITDEKGNNLLSVEYPKSTSSSKVLNDIDAYFEKGTKPTVSDLGKFRYQDRTDDFDDFSTLGDEWFDGDLFDEQTQRILDRFIDEQPDLALDTMYRAAAESAEKGIRGTKSVQLTDKSYRLIARRLMRDYDISGKANPEFEGDFIKELKEITSNIENGVYKSVEEMSNDLAQRAHDALLFSGHLDYSGVQDELDFIRGKLSGNTLIIPDSAEANIRENYGSVAKYGQRIGARVGLERNLAKKHLTGAQGIYIEDIIAHTEESYRNLITDEADGDQGYVWLDKLLNDTLQPQFVSNTYDKETFDAASAEMAFAIASEIIAEKASQLAADNRAGKKLRDLGYNAKKLRDEQKQKIAEAKKQAIANERKKGKERLKKQHERDMKRKNEQLKKVRKKGEQRLIAERERRQNDLRTLRNNRDKRIYIDRIKRLAGEFQQMALHPNDKSYVIPEYLSSGFYEAAQAITDALRLSDSTKVGAALMKLSNTLGQLANEEAYMFEFDEDFRSQVDAFARLLDGKKIDRNLTLREAEDIYRLMREIKDTVKDANKVIRENEGRTVKELGQAVIEDQKSIKPAFFNRHLNGVKNYFMTPERMSNIINGFNDNAALVGLMNDIKAGYRKKNRFFMEANKMFDEYRNAHVKELDDTEHNVREITWTDNVGNKRTVKMTGMQAMQMVMTWNREAADDNLNHMTKGSVTIADPEYLAKGKFGKAYDKAIKVYGLNYSFIGAVQGSLTDFERGYIEIAEKLFNEKSTEAINETSLKLKHRQIAKSKYYIPISVISEEVVKDVDGVKFDSSLENMGMLKSITPHSNKSILICGLDNVINKHIADVSDYYGLAIPIRNLNKVLNVSDTQYDDDGTVINRDTVKSVLRENWGDLGEKVYDQILTDLQGGRAAKGEKFQGANKLIRAIRSNFVTSTLNANKSVVLKQAASYATAQVYLDPSALAGGLVDIRHYIGKGKYKALLDEIDSHTAQHYIRRAGLSSNEIADMQNNWLSAFLSNTSAGRKLTTSKLAQALPGAANPNNWIQEMDCLTTATLWCACKQQVNKDYNKAGKEIGTAAYWQNVTDLYDKVIEDTQPMYDPLHRPEVLKTSNEFIKSVFMFKTQPLQNAGIIYESVGRFAQNKDTASGRQLRKAVTSQTRSLLVFSLMSLAVAFAMHNLKRYKDEDDELTAQSVLSTVFGDMGKNGLGLLLPFGGTEFAEIVSGKYDVFQDNIIEQVNTFVKTGNALVNTIGTEFEKAGMGYDINTDNIVTALEEFAIVAGQDIFGVPIKNVKKNINGYIEWAKDIGNGNELFDTEVQDKKEKQIAHSYAEKVESGNTAEAEKLLTDFYNEELNKAKANQSIKNPEGKASQNTRDMLVNAYKTEYQKAFLKGNTAEMQRIEKILYSANRYMKWERGSNQVSLNSGNGKQEGKLKQWRQSAREDVIKKMNAD